jgi:hypothetical protein
VGARQETEEVLEHASSVFVLVLVYAVNNIKVANTREKYLNGK